MHTWEIARLLLENCDSRQDVDQVLETLNDTLALQELRTMLSSFASDPGTATPPSMPKSETMAMPKLGQNVIDNGGNALPDTSKATVAEQLETLFRSSGMTNKQVEQWFSANFEIDVPIRKVSLRKYLLKVLTGIDLGLGNRILATAQGRLTRNSSEKSDIKDYWDQLEKQFQRVQ